jgi:hypothetical protein
MSDTGGPAFPPQHDPATHPSGMTLRDYFAAKAMQGLMGRSWGQIPSNELFGIWAVSAYAIADVMLIERK